MIIIRFNSQTIKGKRFLEALKNAEEKGHISIEKVLNWKSTRLTLEATHGKAITIKDLDCATKFCEELINEAEI